MALQLNPLAGGRNHDLHAGRLRGQLLLKPGERGRVAMDENADARLHLEDVAKEILALGQKRGGGQRREAEPADGGAQYVDVTPTPWP